MNKTALKGYTGIYPFDDKYIKVSKNKDTMWNLVDAQGKLVSDTWFSSIARNSDNSIVAQTNRPDTKPERIVFLNVETMARSCVLFAKLPSAVFNLVDSDSIEMLPHDANSKYIAKATLYGKTVYITADGDIYDEAGIKLRLLLGTVSSERFHKSMWRFNKKMNYDTTPWADTSLENVEKCKTAAWSFYFITDDLYVTTWFDSLRLPSNNIVRKWTDKIVLRLSAKYTPQSVVDTFKTVLGDYRKLTLKCNDTNYGSVTLYDWYFDKEDIDTIITFLDKF